MSGASTAPPEDRPVNSAAPQTPAPRTPSAVGLDAGTSRIAAAWHEDEEILVDTHLNAFVTIPFSKMTLSVLKKERIPHVVDGSKIRGLRRRVGAPRQPVPKGNQAADAARRLEPGRERRPGVDPPHRDAAGRRNHRARAETLLQRAGTAGRIEQRTRRPRGPVAACSPNLATTRAAFPKAWPWCSARWKAPTIPASRSVAAADCARSAWCTSRFRC